jgi:hypothetical protein
LLDNCSLNTSTLQRIRKQQSDNSVAMERSCKHVFSTIEALFSAWSASRGYKKTRSFELLEFRDASLPGHGLGSRGMRIESSLELASWQNNGKKGIRL